MSQQHTARQSLELALEEYGLNEGPTQGPGLQQLARSSLKDQNELIQAAQEERVQRLKLKKASKQQAAHAAEALFQAPSGLAAFTNKLLQFYRQHGIEWPTVTVEYRHLNVSMEALMGSAGVPTVGNVLPQAAKDVFTRKGAQKLQILQDVSGVLTPGTMTLLLGGPGSGKSTLMKVLTGRLKGKNYETKGTVLYNKKPFSDFVVERTAAYVDQFDRHLPVLTVAETLEFAHACAGKRPDFISKQELKEVYVRTMTGNGPGGTLPVLKSATDISSMPGGRGRAFNPAAGSKPSSAADLSGLDHSISASSNSSRPQGEDAVMSASGFVHAKGEQELLREELAELLKLSGTSFKVELVMRLLGLSHVRDTMIGSAMVRGVSGGERKRVTSGEMLVGNQRVLCMDEISTGLDSAILYSIITFLKQSVSALRSTALISLLQPPPEVMGLFDDIIVLTEGRVIYHGPVAEVQQHFQSIGFDLPPRMDVPSWLVEITTPSGQWRFASSKLKTIWAKQHGRDSAVPPATLPATGPSVGEEEAGAEQQARAAGLALAGSDRGPVDASGKAVLLKSAEELSAAFWKDSRQGRDLLRQVEEGAVLCSTDHNPRSLVTQRYALGVVDALKLALKRQWIFFLRNKAFIVFRLLQMVVMGLIVGSLFFDVPPDRTGVRTLLGASFICLMFLAFGSAPELGLLMMNRSVWYKHRDNYFLPTYAELTSMAIVRAANTAYESVIFSSIVYWMIGYSRDAGAYFTYLLIMFVTSLSMSGLFRFIGSIAATPVHAQAFGSLGILALILTSGFAIIRPSIPGWWIWIYWLSPFSYALRAIVINEMTNARWSAPAPGNPQGLTLGEEGLETFGFYTERFWIWVGVAYVVAFAVLMNFLAYLALKFYSGQQPRASIPDEKELLKRRLLVEERKQHTSVALSVMDPNNNCSRVGSRTTKGAQQQQHSVWAADAGSSGGGNFTPITLVLQDLRYFVPNPSAAGKKQRSGRRRSSSSSSGTSGRASHEQQPGAAATPGPEPHHDHLSAGLEPQDSNGSATEAGAVVRVSVAGQVSSEGVVPQLSEEVPQELELLKGINAFATPGNLLALMGGSGAGKTTLMDCVAGRKTVGRITGDIIVNGLPKHQATWARQVGYVEQMDIHSSNTTVEEALWFSGRLRLPPAVTDAQVRARVDEVLAQVDLTERFGDLVGTPGTSGLPTEARKRLTIAVELMANPPVLFMDEPTSGFDARAATIVMNVVRAVSSAGHTVVVTIHQPSINIFEAFDTLLLLQRGGRVTYFGPLGVHSRALVDYLEAVPGTVKLPTGYNPATWMLEVTGGAMATLIPANTAVDWPEHYLISSLALENARQAEVLVQEGKAAAEAVAAAAGQGAMLAVAAAVKHASGGGYAQPFWRQMLECTRKALGSYWKSPAYNLLRLLMTAACALVYGTMYYKVGQVPSPASIGNVQNVMGVLFSGANFLGNINLMAGMPVFSAERVVFYREQAAMMYDPLALGFATILAELPYVAAQSTVFVPIVYFMVDFRHDAASFFFYYLMNIASLMMFTSFGFFLVSATPMVELAQLFSSALNFLFNIFNGFTIVQSAIPAGWQWANRAVPPTWIIYGLAASQLGDNYSPIDGPGLAPGSTVSSYLESLYGYSYDFRWWALLMVSSYVIGFTVLGVVFLKYVSFLKR